MKVEKLKKLQKHLKTLKLVITNKKDMLINMNLPLGVQDSTRFSINNWNFNCGMPACVAGHAKLIFNWKPFDDWGDKFSKFFDLNWKEVDWITKIGCYKSRNPTPETAAKHIQDVLNGKFKEKV